MYITPGQGQTTSWGQNFDVNRNFLSLCPFVASLEIITLKSDLLPFVCAFFHMYIAPGRGRQPIGDKNLMTTERPFLFAHMLQFSKWSLWNLILYTFLMILYMYIVLGQGQKTPLGTNFWCQQKALITSTICCKFKQISLNSDFIHIFLMFFHMYIAPWGRDRQPFVDKILMSTEKPCYFAHLLQVSKNIFKVCIFCIIFHVFIHMYIAPG